MMFVEIISKAYKERWRCCTARMLEGEEQKGLMEIEVRDRILILDQTDLLWHVYHRIKAIKYRLVVPQSLIGEVLRLCHKPGHFSFKRTIAKAADRFHWKDMGKYTLLYCTGC